MLRGTEWEVQASKKSRHFFGDTNYPVTGTCLLELCQKFMLCKWMFTPAETIPSLSLLRQG